MRRLIILLIILLLSSCATYDSSNYENFKKDLKTSKKITKQVININKTLAEKAFIYEVYNKEKSINKLKYSFKSNLENPPFYYSLDKLDKLIEIHNSLISYSNLLLSIANNDLKNIKSLSQNVSKSVNNIEGINKGKYTEIASFTVYKSYSILTKKKREELLKETVKKNQKFIEKISEILLLNLQTLHQSVYFAYDKYFYDLKTYNRDIDTIGRIVELTNKYQNIKKDLNKLKSFYKKLPTLHKDLLAEKEASIKEFGMDVYKDYSAFSE